MSNSDNNSTQETNEGLNAISLGSVASDNASNNIPKIDPVPPVDLNNSSALGVEAANNNGGENSQNPGVEAPAVINEASQNLEEASVKTEATISDNGVQASEEVQNVNSEAVAEAPANNMDSTVNAIPNEVEPVAPLNYDVPETINSFDPTPVFNNIGKVPPIPDIPVVDPTLQAPKEKKKGFPKPLFVLIVILALAAVGGGVYVFLHKSNIVAPAVVPKNVKAEIGSKLSTNITDYATFNGINSSSCSLNVQDIPSELNTLNAEYTFRIICNEASFSGKLTVVDTVAPEVTIKDIDVALNATVNPEDFIEECKDSTKCSYEFKDAEKVKGNLKEAASYHVDLIIKDEAGNKVEKTAKMIVSDVPIFEEADMYFTCNKDEVDKMVENVKIGIVDGEYKKSVVLKRYSFTIEASEMESLKTENEGKMEMTYKEIVGKPEFSNKLVLSKAISYDTLKSEVGEEIPTNIVELREFLENKGYHCSYEYE